MHHDSELGQNAHEIGASSIPQKKVKCYFLPPVNRHLIGLQYDASGSNYRMCQSIPLGFGRGMPLDSEFGKNAHENGTSSISQKVSFFTTRAREHRLAL